MIRTTHAAHVAPVAAAARPCGLGFGYQWRNAAMSLAMENTSVTTKDNTKKRSARRPGMATT
jgi:hypothetical protein